MAEWLARRAAHDQVNGVPIRLRHSKIKHDLIAAAREVRLIGPGGGFLHLEAMRSEARGLEAKPEAAASCEEVNPEGAVFRERRPRN